MDQATDTSTRRTAAREARTRAFAARQAEQAERYVTPAWLERSFVLPVAEDDMPAQPAGAHDDLDVSAHVLTSSATEAPGFVRPETPEVDFAEVVRRCDATKRARQATLAAFALALLTALAAMVISPTVVVPLAMVLGLAGTAAALWSDGQSRAPVPLRS